VASFNCGGESNLNCTLLFLHSGSELLMKGMRSRALQKRLEARAARTRGSHS
jgi:hypothetical protein